MSSCRSPFQVIHNPDLAVTLLTLFPRANFAINSLDRFGFSALHYSVSAIKPVRTSEGTVMGEELMNCGADPNLASKPDGYSPFHFIGPHVT